MANVELDHVTKRYDSTHPAAVDDVSLFIDDGEFMVLLGPSGCGKSTMLRMIAGLESITSGTMSIDDQVINRIPAKDRDIAMVFQSYALYPHMTVRDNMAFGLRRRRIPKEEVKRRVEETAETLGLTPLLDRKPHALSGGQRQRVALGRASVRNPRVFLFDEPLSNLDAALRTRTRGELIHQYQRLGATMIYVTHDQVEAMTMGTRICVMNEGRISQVGSPLEVYRDPADIFVASFLGSPPTNLLRARVGMEGERVVARAGQTVLALPGFLEKDLAVLGGKEVFLGIRPEDIYVAPTDARTDRYAEMRVKVRMVEPLGAETLVMAEYDGQDENRLAARCGRDIKMERGETVSLFLDLHAVHLFDPKSTKVLPRSGAPVHEAPEERARAGLSAGENRQ